MARATWVQSNFNGGEWSPLAYGRFDLPKYRNGLGLCFNFLATQQGGLTRRGGTRYVAPVKDSSYAPRLVPFVFSLAQSYILEFGASYVRFFTNDGQMTFSDIFSPWVAYNRYQRGLGVRYSTSSYIAVDTHTATSSFIADLAAGHWTDVTSNITFPYEIFTPYTAAEVWELDFTQRADTIYIMHPNHPTMKLQRVGSVSWVAPTVKFLDGPYIPVNTTSTSLTPSGTSGTVTVTASSIVGINGDVGFIATDEGRQLRLKCGGVWLSGVMGTPTNSTHIPWAIDPPNGQQVPATAKAVANVSGGSVFSIGITDGGSGYGVQPPSVKILPHIPDPAVATCTIAGGVVTAVNLTYGGSGYVTAPSVAISSIGGLGAILVCTINAGVVDRLYLVVGGSGYDPAADTVQFIGGGGGGSGAVAYALLTNGVVSSINVSVTGSGYSSAPDIIIADPTKLVPSTTTFWRLGEWNAKDGYPGHGVFYQDRLCLSGNSAWPGKVNGSNTGDYENFAPTALDSTVVDSNAIGFGLDSGDIKWMMADKQGLVCGAQGGEWVISSSGTQQALTQTNVNTKPLGNYGSINVKPVRVGGVMLFIQRTSRKIRELTYQFAYDTFTNIDVSLVSEHLTKSGIKQMAVQFAPQQIVWMNRNDGTMVGMTYDRDQEINGWHWHGLGGYSDTARTLPPLVESVACIAAPDVKRDELWMVVNRHINGATVRTIERTTKTWEDGDKLEDAVCMDSSAVYSGNPTTTVSGLTWLVGETVTVLADGSVHPDCVVSNTGTITLNRAASKIQVGLGFVSRGQTLRIEAGGADGPSQGKLKRVIWTIFRFFQTSRFELWSDTPNVGYESKAFRDSNDPMNTPVALFDGDKRWTYDGAWASDGQISFQASGPLPCNITLIMAQVDTKEMQ